jgi:hypothetical protein
MGRRKTKIEFQMERHGKRKFEIGQVYRFDWHDLYRALQVVHNELPEGNFKIQMEAILNSSREAIHDVLYAVLEAILLSKIAQRNVRVRCAGWIIACYGYCRGTPVPTENATFPLPRQLRRIPKVRVKDIRDELFCPLCSRPFVPPKRYKTRKAISNWFVNKLTKHMELEHKEK